MIWFLLAFICAVDMVMLVLFYYDPPRERWIFWVSELVCVGTLVWSLIEGVRAVL